MLNPDPGWIPYSKLGIPSPCQGKMNPSVKIPETFIPSPEGWVLSLPTGAQGCVPPPALHPHLFLGWEGQEFVYVRFLTFS